MKLRELAFLLCLASPMAGAAQNPDSRDSDAGTRGPPGDINPRPRPPRRPFGGSMEELEKFREKLEDFRSDLESDRRAVGADRNYQEGIREYREGISEYKEAVNKRAPD